MQRQMALRQKADVDSAYQARTAATWEDARSERGSNTTRVQIPHPPPFSLQPSKCRVALGPVRAWPAPCRTRQLSGNDTATHASLVPTVGDIALGSIVEFSVRGNPTPGLVLKRDGKKNWIIADPR